MTIYVTKRDGRKEEVNLDKIHRVVSWACEGLDDVSESEIELRARLQFADGVATKDIHEMLIRSASDLISLEAPDYQFVAARLINYQLRKEVYEDFEPWPLLEIIRKNVGEGKYTAELLTNYSPEEWRELDRYIKHDRDGLIAMAGMEQWRGKYLVKNRVTGRFYETPQVAYMLIAAIGFMNEPKHARLEFVKHFYDELSLLRISLPTPIMAGLRTNVKQFSSCVTIAVGDSLNSIKYSGNAVIDYISRKAGIGLDMGRIRGLDAEIRHGEARHTGLIPFIRKMQSDVKSCSQGGVRGGAATVHFPGWHYEFPELVVLKNNKGTENNRVRHLDYCFLLNRLMYRRLLNGGMISFFSPDEVPGLIEAFSADQDKFEELYEKYENTPGIRKRQMTALEFFSTLHREAYETGRIYFMNIDHANDHGSFWPLLAAITQSNLCQEITLPTVPFEKEVDEEGLISLCTLAAGKWTAVETPDALEVSAMLIVRFLDNLLDYQEYPNIQSRRATMLYRPLGIGIVDLAHFLAIHRVGYDGTGYELVDSWMEAWSYFLIKASVDLAEERGPCEGYKNTKYADGIFPIDTYKKNVDSLVAHAPQYDWDSLKAKAKRVGIRNATLMAQMPAETSAQANNSTNGTDPVQALIVEKLSKDGNLKFVAPGIKEGLAAYYDVWYDHETPRGYLGMMAVLQKWMDQSISINYTYNPRYYPDGKIPMQDMIGDTLFAYQMGLKNRYYTKTFDDVEEPEEQPTSPDVELDTDDCESCKL